jgi:hypothetical protein
MKEYYKLNVPEKSAWDKKSYDPIKWLYHLREEQPDWLEDYFFDPYFSLKNSIKEFFRFIVKMFRWTPVIWRDRDYDDYFIFEILKQKILQQRSYLVKNNRHTNIDQDNFWMTVCLNLIERIQNNYYEIEYFDYFDSDTIFTEVEDCENFEESGKLYEMNHNYKVDNMIDYINKYPIDRKKAIIFLKNNTREEGFNYIENQGDRHTLCVFMSSIRHKKAINLLFKVLSNKIEHWWD